MKKFLFLILMVVVNIASASPSISYRFDSSFLKEAYDQSFIEERVTGELNLKLKEKSSRVNILVKGNIEESSFGKFSSKMCFFRITTVVFIENNINTTFSTLIAADDTICKEIVKVTMVKSINSAIEYSIFYFKNAN